MNLYDIQVRGETVHLEFRRINDSRRLQHYYTTKTPNLFNIRGVMRCSIEVPAEWGGKWWMEHYPTERYRGGGLAFCHKNDRWKSIQGRHESLAGALETLPPDLRKEIVAAFTAEEAKRAKVKGPDTQPKTAKRKLRPQGKSLVRLLHEVKGYLNDFARGEIAVGRQVRLFHEVKGYLNNTDR